MVSISLRNSHRGIRRFKTLGRVAAACVTVVLATPGVLAGQNDDASPIVTEQPVGRDQGPGDGVTKAAGGATAIVGRMDPRLKPQYVELLKRQASERKAFYEEGQKALDELKAKQSKDHENLIQTLRESRHKFMDSSHARDERAMFFRNQRQQMGDFEDRQKAELGEFKAARKKKLDDFHLRQKKDRDALEHELAGAAR